MTHCLWKDEGGGHTPKPSIIISLKYISSETLFSVPTFTKKCKKCKKVEKEENFFKERYEKESVKKVEIKEGKKKGRRKEKKV